MPQRSQTEYRSMSKSSTSVTTPKDEQGLRGLRARFRQRRARNSSEDEVRSRNSSLDITRSRASLPAAHVFPENGALLSENDEDEQGGQDGLVLGEFGDEGDEVVEDGDNASVSGDDGFSRRVPNLKSGASNKQPSGVVTSAYSEDYAQASSDTAQQKGSSRRGIGIRRNRRESTQSMPSYDTEMLGSRRRVSHSDRNDNMSINELSEDYGARSEDGEHSGNYSYEYEYGVDGEGDDDERVGGDDFDADSELNAVYLKRNADFHTLFRNIPINELLIDDYGCALQRDILVQGRLYLTENFVCFYSNIFGWVTHLVIGIDEIVSIEKKMTALIIPNAIQISTLHAKHFFGSFIYRDSAYNQLIDLWGKNRNEKSAGFPEIGHAEGGDGAGDVSRHRGDVLTAYQSLSEDEEGSASDSVKYDSGEGSGSEQDSESGLSDIESESEASDVDMSERSASSKASGQRQVGPDASAGTGRKAGADSSPEQGGERDGGGFTPAAARTRASDSAIDAISGNIELPNKGKNGGGNASVYSAAGTSLLMARTAVDGVAESSVAHSPENLTRAPSQLSAATAKAADTPTAASTVVPGSSAITLPAAKSSKLLARLPTTPDDTEAVHSASALDDSARPVDVPLHKPTTCPCGSNGKSAHYANQALDAVFPLSLPLLFRIVFSASVPSDTEKVYMPANIVSRDLLEKSCTKRITEQGNSDIKTEGWVPDPSDDGLEMCMYTYEKPLGFAIGPKSTMVEDSFRITVKDFDKSVVVEQVVRTPNVPSGNAFFVKIRHCLAWTTGPSNQPPGGWSHYHMTFELEWVKSSWIKNAIEKGTNDSNKLAGEMLEKYIREWIAAHPALEVKAKTSIGGTKSSASGRGSSKGGTSSSHRHRKPKRDQSPQGLRMEELLGQGESERSRRKAELKRKKLEAKEKALAEAGIDASAAAAAKAVAAGDTNADADAKEAEEWKRRASESWAGWASYHTVYPLHKLSQKAYRASHKVLADSVTGPTLVAALLLLLLLTNIWRIPALSSPPALSAPNNGQGGQSTSGIKDGSGGIDGSQSNARTWAKTSQRSGIFGNMWSGLFGPSHVHIDGMAQMQHSVDALAKQMAVINKRLLQLIDQQAQASRPNAAISSPADAV
ncbi:hypothetical protein GGI12_001743 [Dipsacomyces acuminosporus]|nr:hypothetical protein GGI12_001743 [Dipsacomyces acuminosporus]